MSPVFPNVTSPACKTWPTAGARWPCQAFTKQTPRFPKRALSSLQNLAYGGAAMPLPVIRKAIAAFPKTVGFVNAYGQTETTSSLTVLGPDDHRLQGTPQGGELTTKRT